MSDQEVIYGVKLTILEYESLNYNKTPETSYETNLIPGTGDITPPIIRPYPALGYGEVVAKAEIIQSPNDQIQVFGTLENLEKLTKHIPDVYPVLDDRLL